MTSEKSVERAYNFYLADHAIEISLNPQNQTTKILTYVDGGHYEASVIHKSIFNGNEVSNEAEGFQYLHKDYLGSILAISDQEGELLEQRSFNAWGALRVFSKNNITYEGEALEEFIIQHSAFSIDRGYTGHEHLWKVDIIHMNGRLYDASLKRFLGPDNFVQDPYNTQSYNRYGYVWNNPLSLNDPSGEAIVWAAVAVALTAFIPLTRIQSTWASV